MIDEDEYGGEEEAGYDQEAAWDEEWGPQREMTLWWRRDSMSRGRWLYVERPNDDGDVLVGIERVYQKRLSPDEADAMAAALVEAAKQGRVKRAEREAARRRQLELMAECETLGDHQWPRVVGMVLPQPYLCQHCGTAPRTSGYTFSMATYSEVTP